MIIHNCEQGSEEWFAVKCGKISASHFGDVLNKKTGRRTYMLKVLAERMSGESMNGYSNKAMEDGIETEPLAREYYEQLFGEVQQVGFVELNDYVGCSPDGLIGDDGGMEIKCPYPNTHIDYILKNKLPAVYVPQVQGNMWVTGRKWWDFVSFCPKIKDRPFWYIKVERDEKYIVNLASEVDRFIADMQELESKITISF